MHPTYLDEADVRGELTRVFDLCHGCRQVRRSLSVVPDPVRDARTARATTTPAGSPRPNRTRSSTNASSASAAPPGARTPPTCTSGVSTSRASCCGPRRCSTTQESRRCVRGSALQVACRTDLFGRDRDVVIDRRQDARFAGRCALRETLPFCRRGAAGSAPCGPPEATALGVVRATSVVAFGDAATGRDGVSDVSRRVPGRRRSAERWSRTTRPSGVACSMSDAGCCGAPWLHAG